MPKRPLRIAVFLSALFATGNFAAADDVLVFAAASTTVALQETIRRYHEIGEERVRVSFASSGALARQLDNGAPAALYLSANDRWMDWAEKKNLLAPGTRTDLMGNRLVLIRPNMAAPDTAQRDLTSALRNLGENRLAIGDPGHVPAGEYARSALTSLGLWHDLADRTVRAPNVRVVLLLVERREAALGIVYRTDALSSKAVRILAPFPENSHPPVLYGLAMVRDRDKPSARRFYSFLKSTEASKIFRRLGFSAP